MKCTIQTSTGLAYFIKSKPFSVYLCAFSVYRITVTVSLWHHIVGPFWVTIESVDHCAHVTRVTVFLVVFFLRVLTSEGGSVCLEVAILCTVMCFFGVHNELSKPFCLVLFLLVPPSLLPLSYCPPPPTGCAFVTFATRAMAQNAIKTMHHSQTMEVLYPLAPISHFPPLSPPHTFCCPLVLEQ